MKWEEYLKSKNIKLLPWQSEAAKAFLRVLCRDGIFLQRCGKTFIVKILFEYINEHGNDIGIKDGDA